MLCHFIGHTNTTVPVVDSWHQFWLVDAHAVRVVLYFEYYFFTYSHILLACSYLPMEKPAACLLTKNSSVFVFPFLSFPFVSSQTLNRNDAVDVTFSLKGLYDDTKAFLDENLVSGGGWNKGGQRIPSEDGHDRSFLCLQNQKCSILLHHPVSFSLCSQISFCLPLVRIFVIIFRVYLDNTG